MARGNRQAAEKPAEVAAAELEPKGPLFYLVSRHYRAGDSSVTRSACVFEHDAATRMVLRLRQRDAEYGDSFDRWMVPA